MMTAQLTVNKLTKSYQSGSSLLSVSHISVLKDVSFDLNAGEILAVVGESGSGKSTLARQVVQLEQPDSGEIWLDGVAFTALSDVHQRVRMIFQNSAASLNPRKRVYQLLEEPLKNFTKFSSFERNELIILSLIQVGLSKEHAQLFPHMLSGGQRQRVAIARAIILKPEIIVADEAVSALDVSVQAQILNLVMDLRDELRMSWLFITHDISVVNVIADTVMVLYAGRVMEMGPVKQVMEAPLHPYTRNLLQSVPQMGSTGAMTADKSLSSPGPVAAGPACVYLTRCPIADKRCAECIPPMINLDDRQVACLKAAELS